ncbi:sigma-54-dependent transcriptional regulator [Xanthocytophaga flava]|uniref:sigma-54-dependent transcriptional regulator n=1 Tax=Xanthocytophaga flava TaxID=3048013 RepID=UPI0028D0E2A5|nr:sigma-54 dependent transcriptional regulator [Xanthocytophaga flavus]MDJ1468392.1 sigma-54 dependent transcriptional regulator [Xanthocytophaga flavus]
MILIIDDDNAVAISLLLLLRQEGFEAQTASSPSEAIQFVQNSKPELIILDMNFSIETSGEQGLKLLEQILKIHATVPVILITGWATIDLAVKGMKAGAKDFVSKPWSNTQLLQSIRTILSLSQTKTQSISRKKLNEKYYFDNIIGEDPKLLQVLETVGRVSTTDASVLIMGESGTGKELIAEAIHYSSHRQKKSFVKVNLGGISTSLFESEMFGHKRGAFTDAKADRAGRFELAHKGTIFLDEIGELELSNQVKLLRVLQDKTFEVLGSSQTRTVDVRVVSATNRDLEKMVAEGTFREDLFYRINLITVKVPALRERPGDIPLLADFFVNNLKVIYNRPELTISKRAKQWLQTQPLPGNIRQLKNLVERTVLVTQKDILEVEDFSLQPGVSTTVQPVVKQPETGIMTLEEMEIQLIRKALDFHKHRIARVARSLGLSRSALYRRLEKYNIPYDAES